MKITDKMVREVAARIHKCPTDYRGPCWGATEADELVARMMLERAEKKARRA